MSNTLTQPDVDRAINNFITKTEIKRELEAQLRAVREELELEEAFIAMCFNERDQQSVSRRGWIVYMKRDVSVKSATGETADVVEKMRKARLGDLLGLNWPRLKAWVKERMFNEATGEWEIDMTKIPPSLREIVVVDEFYSVHCKKVS